jgi:hypothetical protein
MSADAVDPALIALATELLRTLLARASDTRRLEVWMALREGYCPHCGRSTEELPCYCWNDE